MPAGIIADAQDSELDLEMVSRLRLVLGRIARVLRQQSASGIPLSRQSALATITARGPITLGDLARREQVTPPTVTKLVSNLEADGLVERCANAADRRVVHVVATAAGHASMTDSRTRRDAWLARRLATLDDEQLDVLRSAVDVLEQLTEAEGAA